MTAKFVKNFHAYRQFIKNFTPAFKRWGTPRIKANLLLKKKKKIEEEEEKISFSVLFQMNSNPAGARKFKKASVITQWIENFSIN